MIHNINRLNMNSVCIFISHHIYISFCLILGFCKMYSNLTLTINADLMEKRFFKKISKYISCLAIFIFVKEQFPNSLNFVNLYLTYKFSLSYFLMSFFLVCLFVLLSYCCQYRKILCGCHTSYRFN